MFRKLLLAGAALLAPTAASAEWRSATSRHFIVYSEGSVASTQALAEKLEKYAYVLRVIHHAEDRPNPVKLKLYMVPDMKAVQQTMPFNDGGTNEGGVAGYYSGDRRGPYAVMPRTTTKNTEGMGVDAQGVLFHEMTHHFMFQYFPGTYPTWYVEGIADFYGSMNFTGDTVDIGRTQEGRLQNMQYDEWLPVEKLLTARSYADVKSVYMLYAEGWLLVHYMYMNTDRKGQLSKFLAAVQAGVPYAKAATDAFGDLGRLNAELSGYAQKHIFPVVTLPFKKIDPGTITMAVLPPAQQAMIEYDLQLSAGVPQRDIAAFADRVQATAAGFPNDPYALHIQFEAQRLAGRSAAAAATADAWLKVVPTDGYAMMARGLAATDALRAAKVTDRAQWSAARRSIVDAARAIPGDPFILRAFYDSFVAQGQLPPANAQAGLFEAFQEIPQDETLRQEVAADFEARGMFDDAIAVIRPVAFAMRDPSEETPKQRAKRAQDRLRYNMAGSDDDSEETARTMLTRLEKKRAEAKAAAPPAATTPAPATS